VTAKAVLELQGVGRRFAGPPPVEALRGVDLTAAAGEFVAVRGPSGSGKSTLLNILGMLDRPTFGEYLVAGRAASGLGTRERDTLRGHTFGFVFQSSHLIGSRTVAANVALALQVQRTARSRRGALVATALDAVGLRHKAQSRGGDLSGGERQRVAIARAIVGRPRVVLADEPTGNLDQGNADRVVALLREISLSGLTVVVITHDPRVAEAADRQVHLLDGLVAENALGDSE
jgi:ABC-type lipoprotein export system ATPase subunit